MRDPKWPLNGWWVELPSLNRQEFGREIRTSLTPFIAHQYCSMQSLNWWSWTCGFFQGRRIHLCSPFPQHIPWPYQKRSKTATQWSLVSKSCHSTPFDWKNTHAPTTPRRILKAFGCSCRNLGPCPLRGYTASDSWDPLSTHVGERSGHATSLNQAG